MGVAERVLMISIDFCVVAAVSRLERVLTSSYFLCLRTCNV